MIESGHETPNFELLARLSRGLWSDSNRAQRVAEDVICAIAIGSTRDDYDFKDVREETQTSQRDRHLPRPAEIDRAVLAILEQANRSGVAANPDNLNQPFYRLSPLERFMLIALHTGGWSYEKLARFLDVNYRPLIEQIWKLRVSLATQTGVANPVGGQLTNLSCPDYSAENPWTQRLLDDEMNQQERLFFQNHMMACESCRKTLDRARRVYFAVEKMIPGHPSREALTDSAMRLNQIWSRTRALAQPETFLQSLRPFVRRREIQFALGLLTVILASWLWQLSR